MPQFLYTKQLIAIILLSTALSSCDKGRNSLDNFKSKYSNVISSELDSRNSEEAAELAAGLKIIAKVHSEKASGKEALDTLTLLQNKARLRLSTLQGAAMAKAKTLEASAADIIAQSKKLKKLAKKSNLLSFNPKLNSCVIKEFGSEFSKDKDQFEIEIYKIVKLGKDEMVYETIYKAQPSDFENPDEALAQKIEPKTEFINLKIGSIYDCKKALQFRDDYRALLTKYSVEINPLMKESRALKSVLSEEPF